MTGSVLCTLSETISIVNSSAYGWNADTLLLIACKKVQYFNRIRQSCKVDDVSLNIQFIDIGVPQGSCFGPLLFCYTSVIHSFSLRKAQAIIYAHNITIFYSSDYIENLSIWKFHALMDGFKETESQ